MEELRFETWSPVFHHCQVEVGGALYSSGLVTERPWSSVELEAALPAIRAAFATVQHHDPHALRDQAAGLLGKGADLETLRKCDLVSLSAVWDADAAAPHLSLAFGFDEGVYFTALMHDGAITSAELAD
ncbi:hypothetical protein [Arthrobacter woluwensis]|uniref:hypothetical protein n=1 Tax=Arthrobacter woluwensis TaxID=156980 RepID=UPI0011B22A16|nr:hypothetical protein [Arthrobacter woluwensis]